MEVQSEALAYTVAILFVSLVILYLILLASRLYLLLLYSFMQHTEHSGVSRFVLSRTLGVVSLVIYVLFLTVSVLFEMNVFFEVNLPMCASEKYT